MQRFDFNNSDYASFFRSKNDGAKLLQLYIDSSAVLNMDYGWALTQGRIAGMPIPTGPDGAAVFQMESYKLEAAPLMDLRAPLGDSLQMDAEGMDFYTASIPDFIGRGWTETAVQRAYKEKQYEQFGNDAKIIARWTADSLLRGLNQAKATLNLMTAQLQTTGKIDYRGMGAGIYVPLHDAKIPSVNFYKAGEKAWNSPDCKILTQMRKIEDKYREERGGYNGALVWKMTKKMYHDTFLQNAEVIALYEKWCTANYIAYVQGMPITNEQFLKSIADIQGISPIEIVVEKERNKTATTDTTVQGWKDNIVVLRPAGDAVEFQYTDSLDEAMQKKYGASSIDSVFATMLQGLVKVMNITTDNGRFKEWHTDTMMSATPALLSFTNHVIVDTATAE